jgi:alkylated DNA repair dioxygenase AlkB
MSSTKIKCFGGKTITLTAGDRAENHKGMQIIGESANCGYSSEELRELKQQLEIAGHICELHNLHELSGQTDVSLPEASFLIVRNYIKNADEVYIEQSGLNVDKKAFMYGRVVNKHARHNLCFDDGSQEPDYEKGKGRIVAFNDVPLLKALRSQLVDSFGEKAKDLKVEGNYYYDITKTKIGWHGDFERKIVIGMRLGETFPFYYQWYHKHKTIGNSLRFNLNHGDIYIMSEKSVGTDWKQSKIPTLRHAAGDEKHIKIADVNIIDVAEKIEPKIDIGLKPKIDIGLKPKIDIGLKPKIAIGIKPLGIVTKKLEIKWKTPES